MKFITLKGAGPLVDLINRSDYFNEVESGDISGCLLYGLVDPEGPDWPLAAGVVVVATGPMAYVDYLVVDNRYQGQGLAVELLQRVSTELKKMGVRRVCAFISGDNGQALSLAPKFRARVGFPYMSLIVDLEANHGQEENGDHAENHDCGDRRARTGGS